MPRVKPQVKGRHPFEPGEAVVALEAGYGEYEDGPVNWRTNDLFTADDAPVKNCPGSFAPANLKTAELAAWLPPVPETPTYESDFRITQPAEIALEDQVVCIEPIGTLTRSVKAGQVVSVSDPLVKMSPSSFVWHRRLSEADLP